MAINYVALKSELTTDPRGYGYSALIQSGSDAGLATALNLIRDGSAGRVPVTPTAAGGQASGIITVSRTDVTAQEVRLAVDVAEFVAGPNALLAGYFESVTQSNERMQLKNQDAGRTDTRQMTNLKTCFSVNASTRARLDALATRSGSRAEELFGVDTTVDAISISIALRST